MRKTRYSDIVLTGAMVRLRAVAERDLPKLLEWDEDEEISRWAGKKFSCRAEARDWYLDKPPANKRTFVIETLDGDLIGEVEILNISWRIHTGELRVVIGEKHHWNQGLGTDAVVTFTRWVFDTYSIDTIYLRVDKENYRARRCYAKAGFKPVGRLKFSSERNPDPGVKHLILMKMSRTEWHKRALA
ncbi:MAG: GNAT family N-acetyltransferase [Bacillota bacterium]|nr:GNAT family N-acetyltransferase [Candidatus Fermentithermobacillaceae bacterium]